MRDESRSKEVLRAVGRVFKTLEGNFKIDRHQLSVNYRCVICWTGRLKVEPGLFHGETERRGACLPLAVDFPTLKR